MTSAAIAASRVSGMDDVELLVAWRAGDAAAGNEIIDRHVDAVIRVFRNKVGDATDDLVQRTFLVCLERAELLSAPQLFRNYLLKVARNVLYRHFREQAGPRGQLDTMPSSVHELAPTPSSVLGAQREREMLLAALRSIPLDLQVALELYYWEGLRGPELADVLGLPEGTARSRLRLAKQRIRVALEQVGARACERLDADGFDRWAASLRESLARGR